MLMDVGRRDWGAGRLSMMVIAIIMIGFYGACVRVSSVGRGTGRGRGTGGGLEGLVCGEWITETHCGTSR